MNREASLMSGILLLTVPTIQDGGYFLLRLFSGKMPGIKPSPLQISFFRAGRAHAGVLVILSLICQIFAEKARLKYPERERKSIGLRLIRIPRKKFPRVASRKSASFWHQFHLSGFASLSAVTSLLAVPKAMPIDGQRIHCELSIQPFFGGWYSNIQELFY